MKINYNVTGKERKSLVAAISQELNAPTKYLGMPTAAYEVGGYTIDKTGTVTGEDNRELVSGLCGLHSFKAESGEYDTPLPELDADDENPDIDQHRPGRYADPNEPPTEEMLKQAAAWMEGQPDFESLQLTEREELGLGREHRENWQGENGMQASDVPERYHYRAELNDPDSPERMEVFSADNDEDAIRQAYGYTGDGVTLLELLELDGDYNEIRSVDLPRKQEGLVIEIPLTGFTPEKLDNLFKLVNAKAALLKAALGAAELPIKQTANTLQFPWFWEENILTSEETAAYATLVSLLCKTAKEKKRVTAKEKAVEGSPKYAMRCFLLSLGFIGDEYKTARKILLSRLEGNSSWKNGKKAEAVTEPSVPDSECTAE